MSRGMESHHFYGLAQLFRFESWRRRKKLVYVRASVVYIYIYIYILIFSSSCVLSPPSYCIVGWVHARSLLFSNRCCPEILRQWILFSNNIVILWARRTGGREEKKRERWGRREMTWSLCSPSCLPLFRLWPAAMSQRQPSRALSSSSLSSCFFPIFLIPISIEHQLPLRTVDFFVVVLLLLLLLRQNAFNNIGETRRNRTDAAAVAICRASFSTPGQDKRPRLIRQK